MGGNKLKKPIIELPKWLSKPITDKEFDFKEDIQYIDNL